MKAFIATHPVVSYFALTFAISWGGVLVLIGGPAGMTGIKAQDNTLFPFAVLAMVAGPGYDRTESLFVGMLMHLSLTSSTLILTPQTTGMPLLAYGLVFAAAVWAVIAVIAVANSRRPSRPWLRRRVASTV